MRVFILAASLFSIIPVVAQAKCLFPRGYPFFPDQNDTVTYTPTTDARGCAFNFYAGDRVTFTSASILSPAKNGTFVQLGAFDFRYKPRDGFKGQDTYSVKVCGKNLAGSGCSTINYKTTVE